MNEKLENANQQLVCELQMQILPMPTSAPAIVAGTCPLPLVEGQSLAEAFACFTDAAASLERCYEQLQREVTRLREELARTNQDLTQSLEGHARTRQYLNRILEGLPCGVVVLDHDGRVVLENQEAERLLGSACHEPASAVIRELLAGAGAAESETAYRRPDGREQTLGIRRAQLDHGESSHTIVIVQDVTALRQLQQERELYRRRQALAEMSAVLAHEIRNPLGSMELFAGLLAGSRLEAEQAEWLQQLVAGLRTLGATVNNVLHFHSTPPLETSPVNPGQLLEWLGCFLQPLAEQQRIQIVLRLALQHATITADRHRLEQVLLNLGLNALRFMPGGGQLTLSGRCQAQIVLLEVSDTGPGISGEYLDRIFEPGFSRNPGSPGLGLAVCKTIMQQHGGCIRVTSSLGRGTTFILELPQLCP